jgi:hypothetical protein
MKDIKGYVGLYQINEFGDVYYSDKKYGHSMRMGGKMTSWKNTGDYLCVSLCKNGKRKSFSIHRLVALHYIPNPLNLPEVNHNDGNKLNCHYSNLEWCTNLENQQHAWRTGLKHARHGEETNFSKLTKQQVQEIRMKYIPRLYTQKILAKEYDVTQANVSIILNNKSW